MADRMIVDEASQVRTKGRGFSSNDDARARNDMRMDEDVRNSDLVPERSIEGWILIVRGVHPEADEEGLMERFSDYGTVKNLHLNLDRRTGYAKGYALIEYETLKEAQTAINEANGTTLYDEPLQVDFAFTKDDDESRGSRRGGDRRNYRDRSLSPGR
ncbi:hypothetical protein LRAMOSA01688 [Lichtheimia ramosa]|uniref:RRM domain-containing protein n=1 Tax=Lichtheimia ramosa TaxID=688394 RepID=A0A077WKT9_9FUNG|nr:hypothetical protein LRAMOSA01688 [Lichtheimia ramosa]